MSDIERLRANIDCLNEQIRELRIQIEPGYGGAVPRLIELLEQSQSLMAERDSLKAEVERMRVVIDMAHDALVASQWSDSTNYGCTACCPDCRETDEHSSSCDHAKAIEACRSALEVDEALRRAGGAP